MNTTSVDAYLADGCGRCDLYQTAACKVLSWTEALVELRAIARASGLTEEMKWGSPCYTDDGQNIAMIGALKDCCTFGFFKGVLLDDPDRVLEAPGPNSQSARQVRFRSVDEVRAKREILEALIVSAVAVERSGAKVTFEREPVPEELAAVLASQVGLQAAFDALTPGRQRSYILHVAGAKQAASRTARALRCVAKIREGKGFHER